MCVQWMRQDKQCKWWMRLKDTSTYWDWVRWDGMNQARWCFPQEKQFVILGEVMGNTMKGLFSLWINLLRKVWLNVDSRTSRAFQICQDLHHAVLCANQTSRWEGCILQLPAGANWPGTSTWHPDNDRDMYGKEGTDNEGYEAFVGLQGIVREITTESALQTFVQRMYFSMYCTCSRKSRMSHSRSNHLPYKKRIYMNHARRFQLTQKSVHLPNKILTERKNCYVAPKNAHRNITFNTLALLLLQLRDVALLDQLLLLLLLNGCSNLSTQLTYGL